MSRLIEYTRRTVDSRGLMYQRNMAILRNYINTTTEEELIRFIYEITDSELLKTLWAAGLKQPLQRAVLIRQGELTGRRSEF